MLRLVLLLLYLASFSWSQADSGGGWDPDGLTGQPPSPSSPGDAGGGWDPNG